MLEKLNKQALKMVQEICKKNGYAFVAYKLGYKSSTTVEAWVRRRRVPAWCLERIDELYKEQKSA